MRLIDIAGMISAVLLMMVVLLAQVLAKPFLPKDDPFM